MIRILSSFAIIVAAAAVIAGGTYSYFTDTETQNNNTFAAGTVNISLENPQGELPFEVTNWAPGDVSELRLDVINEGSLDVTVTGDASGSWNGDLGDQMVKVIGMQYYDGSEWVSAAGLDPEIKSGQKLKLKVFVEFDEDAGDDFQGKTYKASFFVKATQADNMES